MNRVLHYRRKRKGKAMQKPVDYKTWFLEKWNENGGMITQKNAALILKKTPTRIRQMINEGKLKAIHCPENEAPFVSLQQVLEIYRSKPVLEEISDTIDQALDNGIRKIMNYPPDVYSDDPKEEFREKVRRHRKAQAALKNK